MRIKSTNAITALLAFGFCTLAFNAVGPVRADDSAQPLPFHSIEGYGGGAITPTAYLSNPTPNKQGIGEPSFAVSYVNLGSKSLSALTGSETLFGRLELSLGADQLQLGTLPDSILKATSVNIDQSSEWLYSWNARYLAVKESTNVPAVTIGVQFKDNSSIAGINHDLGGALGTIGYKNNSGEDYTLTASKLFPKVAEHPLIVTAGLRDSEAATLGFLGFGNSYKTTFEGSLIYLPTSKVVLAYEFRGNSDPYSEKLAPVIGHEGNWNAFDASYIVSPHSTIVVGTGNFGTLADTTADHAWWVQLKDNL
jgi:hypothetical protein